MKRTIPIALTVAAMRPGARVSELQALAREAYRKAGLPNSSEAIIFFHGLGLSHMDLEQRSADGSRAERGCLESITTIGAISRRPWLWIPGSPFRGTPE